MSSKRAIKSLENKMRHRHDWIQVWINHSPMTPGLRSKIDRNIAEINELAVQWSQMTGKEMDPYDIEEAQGSRVHRGPNPVVE